MVMVLAAPFLALHGFAVMVAMMRAVLGMIAVRAGRTDAEATDHESGADGQEGNDPAYALRHGSPFVGEGRLAIGRLARSTRFAEI
jgi:hypothetical protein